MIRVGVLLDESGSMRDLRDDVVGGIDIYLSKLKGKKASAKTRVSLFTFDASGVDPTVRPHFEKVPVDSVEENCARNYSPRGATPLNDAVLWTIKRMRGDAKKGDNVLLVIFTDGYENASEADAGTVRRAVERAQGDGWEFIYLGANQDAWAVGQQYGMARPGQTFTTRATAGGMSAALRTAGNVSTAYAAAGAMPDAVKGLGDQIGEDELEVDEK